MNNVAHLRFEKCDTTLQKKGGGGHNVNEKYDKERFDRPT